MHSRRSQRLAQQPCRGVVIRAPFAPALYHSRRQSGGSLQRLPQRIGLPNPEQDTSVHGVGKGFRERYFWFSVVRSLEALASSSRHPCSR